MSRSNKYVGHRDPVTMACTILVEDAAGNRQELDPRFDLLNKSPSGLEWGYNGSGPAQTALAILVAHLTAPETHAAVLVALGETELPDDGRLGLQLHEYLAIRYFQKFKTRVVSRLTQEDWEMTGEDIERSFLGGCPNDDGRNCTELFSRLRYANHPHSRRPQHP